LGRSLAKKYGFVYVSSEALLSDQIARKTEVGRIALNAIKNGELGSKY
jgi:adenylate kinase family enzyme